MNFQYFSANIQKPQPLGYVSLEYFLHSTKEPKAQVLDVFKQIAEASINKDEELRSKLKQNYLHYFTPCVNLNNGRKYTDIISFTGLLVLDFDKIDNAEELKNHLFYNYDYIISAWLSPSKKGVKCLVSIPICTTTDEFKEYFYGITLEMELFDGFDTTSKNCVLPLFQSYDKDLLYRENYSTFDTKAKDPNAYVHTYVQPIKVDTSDRHLRSVHNITRAGIDKIIDNGFPQLRSVSLVLGGYVASNYISQSEAESLIYNLIESNAYLSKKQSIYKKTAKWAIEQGMNKQLILRIR